MADFFDFGHYRTFGVIYVKKSIIMARLRLVHVFLTHAVLMRRLEAGLLPYSLLLTAGRYNFAIFTIYDFLAYKQGVDLD